MVKKPRMISQINKIKFGILSDQDILDMSVCIIDKPSLIVESRSVYDLRLGSTNTITLCETCGKNVWQCTGHFGHIELNTPIILFYKQVASMLKCFCINCSRILCLEDELTLNKIYGYDNIINYLSKNNTCIHCRNPHPEIKFSASDNTIYAQLKFKNNKTIKELTPEFIKQVFDNVLDQDVKLLGVNVDMFRPKNFVLTKFPVLPTTCRPRMITPDNISDDDLSIILADIIKNNNLLTTNVDAEKYTKIISTIKFRTLTYCDNTRGKAVHNTNHKIMTGIKERIARKEGIIRKNLMGKRCDQTGRTVIGPDPTLKMTQVGVPIEMADSLTIPEYVTPYNIDRLTILVNNNQATTICSVNGIKKNVDNAIISRKIHLQHGDLLIKQNGTRITVNNCKLKIQDGDVIQRGDKIIKVSADEKRHVSLIIGDKVERFLQNGDIVVLNRQPTLHKNSMQGMQVVRHREKTLRIPLSQAEGYNADFDGDEMNLFIPQTLEAQAEIRELSLSSKMMLSIQTNKPVVVIVQDSLLGAYLMTNNVHLLSKDNFCQCLYKTNCLDVYDFRYRLDEIQTRRNEVGVFTTPGLLSFLFPRDFFIDYDEITIEYGIIVRGFLSKSTLGGTKKSLIRILFLEYGEKITADFVDNIQFITNAWLEFNACTIGIEDCLTDPKNDAAIKNIINKAFMEAEHISCTIQNSLIRESKINISLNKAKDVGLKLAKDTLKPTNNFINTVASGSKGDYFNIAQIMGLLGQQNISGKRPCPTLDNNKRTMVHYPRIIPDPRRIYESRGFVSSSFIKGLNENEAYFHAMSGREGMINTSLGTATSGYIQRRTVKMTEDLKIAYDGTVRDAGQNIYQFAFGGHGYDPGKITITDKEVFPCDVKRLAIKLNSHWPDEIRHSLTQNFIDETCNLAITHLKIPLIVANKIVENQKSVLKQLLIKIKLVNSELDIFQSDIIRIYQTSKIAPGECVGILGAQSIGEKQTQMTLNTFHTAGKLQQTGVGRFQELLNTTKDLKVKTCTIYFKKKYRDSKQLREDIGSSIVALTLNQVTINEPEIVLKDNTHIYFRYYLDHKAIYNNRLTPEKIIETLQNTFADCKCIAEPLSIIIGIELAITTQLNNLLEILNKTQVCGIEGIHELYLNFANDEWFAITDGSNLIKLLAHPLIDSKRIYCNNIWEVNECLGIVAAKKILFDDIKENVSGVNDFHIELLVDKMTFKGKPTPITRYSMRTNDVGPLSKATFEESIDTIITAAIRTEVDINNGVSAAIISGNQPKIGTGYMGLMMDIDKFGPDFYGDCSESHYSYDSDDLDSDEDSRDLWDDDLDSCEEDNDVVFRGLSRL